jgi:acylphosphatase
MRVARRFLVSGRVQGVGFRLFVRDAADRDGIQGLARNLDDGRVEVVAEGDAEAMSRFERAVRRGPSHARVTDVQLETLVPGGHGTGFTIG